MGCGFGAEDGLDVEDRGLVDGFEGGDVNGEAVDAGDGGAVEADGVGAVGGAGGEDSGDGVGGIGAGVDAEGFALGLVEPGEDPDVLIGVEAFEGLGVGGEDLEGGGGCAAGLAWGVGAVGEGGADVADLGENHGLLPL